MPQKCISPLEEQLGQFSDRTIKTFVFMKAKTTGIYPRELEPRKNQEVMNKPMPSDVYRQELLRYMNDCDLTQLPRMAALAFLSVPRDVFTNSMNTMQKKFDNEKASIEVATVVNSLHLVINHEVSEEEATLYQKSESSPLKYSKSQNRRLGCNLNQTFGQQWRAISGFLETVPKPACLVAHFGQYFDFPVFLGEIKRAGINGLPEGLYFMDSCLATQNMERTLLNGLFNQLRNSGETQSHRNPWQLMRRGRTPPAFLRRLSEEEFQLNNGQWKYCKDLKTPGRYALAEMYNQIFGKKIDKPDYALPASETILQVCLAYGSHFLGYADASAAELPRPT